MKTNNVEQYGWSSSEGPHSCDYISPEVLTILKELSAVRIADIGSGNGKLCSQMFAKGFDVVGVEADAEGAQIASANYPKIPFYRMAVEDSTDQLLAVEKPFDTVVSTEVIEHLYLPHLLPIFAHKILADNGHLVITTPYHGYLKNLALSLFGKWDDHFTVLWPGGHIKFWSRKTLTLMLEKHGFRVVGFRGVGRVAFLWKSMIVIAKKV